VFDSFHIKLLYILAKTQFGKICDFGRQIFDLLYDFLYDFY